MARRSTSTRRSQSSVIADGKHLTLDASRTAIGKTAELEAQSFEDTFIDLAQMLGDWHDESEAAGVDAATRAAVGASSEVGLHRVRKPVTDNCAQALKMASIICGKIVSRRRAAPPRQRHVGRALGRREKEGAGDLRDHVPQPSPQHSRQARRQGVDGAAQRSARR